MRKIYILLIFTQFSLIQFGQVIADHTVVDQYDNIPQYYLDKVKKLNVHITGMSHAKAYYIGADLLELLDPRFQVLTYTTEPPPPFSDKYLRLGRPWMTGEAAFYTSQKAIDAYKTVHLRYSAANPYNVIGFGWSYQATWTNSPGGTKDPVYKVRWAGSSDGGVDGDKIWGLDKGDSILTGNRVCMDSYLNAMEQYIKYCKDNNYPTTMMFTNGVVDGNSGTELGFQRELKNQHIRNYIEGKDGYFFFDYADILVHNNAGNRNTVTWNDGGQLRAHDQIHPENLMNYDNSWNIIVGSDDGDHIGEVGALRLAKALWWMLARIEGWDGISTSTSLNETEDLQSTEIVLNRASEYVSIKTNDKFLNGHLGLYNSLGCLIDTKNIYNNINEINTTKLSDGLYLLVLTNETFTEVKKFVLLR